MSAPKVGIVSLGCSKNLVDTEVMLGHLDEAGCRFVQEPGQAEVLVVNTCSFIGPAREESIRTILDAAALKRSGRLKRLIVAGCMVQRYRDELARELAGEVDAFIGLDELDEIVGAAGIASAPAPPKSDLPMFEVQRGRKVLGSELKVQSSGFRVQNPAAEVAVPHSELSTPNSEPSALPSPPRSTFLYTSRTPRKLATPPWTAFVKIAEGCDHTCAFCAIPAFRGVFRSRPAADVVAEAESLARGGVREINLIAQDSSHYGRDRDDRGGLADLLARLDAVPELRWIRVHYLYPNTVTDRLIAAMAGHDRVVKYVDMPLQHAHPDTLKRMRRGGSGESHLALLDRFRRAMPDAALRSTFIVGFPGETDDEFEALLTFVREARFDHLGAFAYSHEESTAAFATADDVPEEVKRERRDRLMALQQEIAFERARRRVGTTVEVLVEGAHPDTDDLLVGRMDTQAPDVDGQVLINDGFVLDAPGGDPRLARHARPGSFARVELTDTAGYDLVGRILGAA